MQPAGKRAKFAPYDPRRSHSWRRRKVAPLTSEPRSDTTAATATSSSDQPEHQNLAPDAQSIMPRCAATISSARWG
ncbi:hypothetical protein V5799_021055 [Amblyomma americanum]|uniref:Uncharacterized protein n=1 Tax=Amblyomma americanum TaxID=6943 RepID=A0AAQ4FPH5_AMBAM